MSYEYLAHHGVKGQKWGVRRYQNEDGTLTEEGRKRYGIDKQKYFTKNVRETARRSAWSSAKSSTKTQSVISGVAAAASGGLLLATFGTAALPAAAIAAGSTFVGTVGGSALAGSMVGYMEGAKIGHEQDKTIRNCVSRGEKFTLSQLTATTTVANLGPYYHAETKYSSRK